MKFEPDGTNYLLLGKTRRVLEDGKEFKLMVIPLSVGKLKLPVVKFLEYNEKTHFEREIEGLEVRLVDFGFEEYLITQK